MELSELAFACYIYERIGGYDESLYKFRENTKPNLDIRKPEHRIELLKWLNKWGCRQFAKEYHILASKEIKCWYEECNNLIFLKDRCLLELSENELESASKAYLKLTNKIASKKKVKNKELNIRIGATGAAKILFALRPKASIIWDGKIRKKKCLDESSTSYKNFHLLVKNMLEEIRESCLRNDFNISDLPKKVGRTKSSLVKLIDEYFWVTITRNCPAPTRCELERWRGWK